MRRSSIFLLNVLALLVCIVWTMLAPNGASAATFTVTVATDAGVGSLRAAITAANAAAGADVIDFAIPGTGPHTITLASELPSITGSVSIQGYTQAGSGAANLMVVISGAGRTNCIQFSTAGAAGSVLEGICLQRASRGIHLLNTTNITIQGCIVGLNPTGTSATGTGCTQFGVFSEGSTSIQLGNAGLLNRNIISGNTQVGNRFQNSNNSVIRNNYIGTDATGTVDLGNTQMGITLVNSPGLTIQDNLISGNNEHGVFMENCDNAVFYGNYIGTDVTGALDLGNTQYGARIATGSDDVIFGGAAAGQGNVVSGNNQFGVMFDASLRAVVKGNRIGTNAVGTAVVGNSQMGINFSNSSNNATVGGILAGEPNVISGNGQSGLYTNNSDNLTVVGNFIGTDITGALDFGNGTYGMEITGGSDGLIVGGATAAHRNIISGNGTTGLTIVSSANALVEGNYIGVSGSGLVAMPNALGHGINIDNPTSAIPIIRGNVIGANQQNGVRFGSVTGAQVLNNYIGVDATGNAPMGNGFHGVIFDNSPNGLVDGNIVCDNGDAGIHFVNSSGGTVIRNRVGLGLGGSPMGNDDQGVQIVGNTNNTMVGGSLANANIIAYNGYVTNQRGIEITTGDNNNLSFNSIYCNANQGIFLGGGGNNDVAQPVVTLRTANVISGTSTLADGSVVTLYINSTGGMAGCGCEGETFVQSGTVIGGLWSITHNNNYSATAANNLTVLVTNATNNTTIFSNCTFTPLPVEYLLLNATQAGPHAVNVAWQTAMERNARHFEVERSTDGQYNFHHLGTVPAHGNAHAYQFMDTSPALGANYYRLRQVDLDGNYAYSETRQVIFTGHGIAATHTQGAIQLEVFAETDQPTTFQAVDMAGRVVAQGSFVAAGGALTPHRIPTINWANGVYTLRVQNTEAVLTQKVLVVGL